MVDMDEIGSEEARQTTKTLMLPILQRTSEDDGVLG